MIKIGYACQALAVENTQLRSCIMKNADEERLTEIIDHNLDVLERIIEYNRAQEITLFRISSELVPFGSSPVNTLQWDLRFEERFREIGRKLKEYGIRVSMHPGQYTVLNSPDTAVVKRAVEDLEYHCKVLDALKTAPDSKLILHVGGTYQDKEAAMKRFGENYKLLHDGIKARLVLENDDKSYTISDVLELGLKLGIPVVFDHLHNRMNCSDLTKNDSFWIEACKSTWKDIDGRQKIHYSQQENGKKPGSHSLTIETSEFVRYYESIRSHDLDVMLEVKDKNLSAVKCIHLISQESKGIRDLEKEWARYKYTVLERSPRTYQEIRMLLKDKTSYPAIQFYRLIDEACKESENIGHFVNAAMHIWGYFKHHATEKERTAFLKSIEDYRLGSSSSAVLKRQLERLNRKYANPYLTASYYFLLG